MYIKGLIASFLVFFLSAGPAMSAQSGIPMQRPKLLVMIVIDQFRADYLTRFQSRFLPAHGKDGQVGGFQYLMTQGAYYPFGQYDLMQSITGPGHATVLTGAYPYQAGISLNEWYDRSLQRYVYCSEDTGSPLVGPDKTEAKEGRSPRNLVASTVGDELKNAGFPSRVVSVSLKDRSAIFMGGHRADMAIWFHPKSNQWISSQHYLPNKQLPEWVKQLTKETALPLGKTVAWNLQNPGTGYSDSNTQPLTDKSNGGAMGGKDFPHITQFGDSGSLANPLGLEITETAAERALEAYQLGTHPTTDLLAVSFSSHDFVGHAFGPNSREMEEMTVHEDRVIAKFLNFLKKKVPGGLNNVVIAFTADHGVAPTPEWAQAHKLQAGRLDEKVISDSLSNHLNGKFGKPKEGKWISTSTALNFYLNLAEIEAKKIDRALLETEAKAFLEKIPGIAFVFSSSDYRNRKLPPGILERQILHTYCPGRNGELVVIPKPFYINEGATTTHLTGYSYDRSVPIILAGARIKPGIYATRAEVVDIAATLSFLSQVLAPSLSEGRVLSEILK